MLRTVYLQNEYANIVQVQKLKMSQAANITINIDGWSNSRKQSLYGSVAITPSREAHLLSLLDISSAVHNTGYLTG